MVNLASDRVGTLRFAHPTSAGKLAGNWAVSVNGNWRLTFKFEGQDAVQVDYQDYH